MKKVLSAIGVGSVYLFPVIALAAPSAGFGDIGKTAEILVNFINSTLVPLVFAIAFLLFLWGIFKYFIWGGGDEAKREEGKQLMLWAIIAFVVMISVWGIVKLISTGLGINDENIQYVPDVPTGNT